MGILSRDKNHRDSFIFAKNILACSYDNNVVGSEY